MYLRNSGVYHRSSSKINIESLKSMLFQPESTGARDGKVNSLKGGQSLVTTFSQETGRKLCTNHS